MKLKYFHFLNYIILLSALLLNGCGVTHVKDGSYKFEIYATNDVHGRIFDSLYTEPKTYPYSLASVSTCIKDARKRVGKSSVVLLDIGDNLQGDNSVFYFNTIDTKSKHLYSRVSNYLKYDAAVVGNHDIEAGHSVYDKLDRELKAPYLAANAVSVNNGKPYFEPYTIINRGGVKIAVIGMTNSNIKKWLSQTLWNGLDFIEIVPLIDKIVADVRKKENPHLVIAAIHSGLGSEDTLQIENTAKYVAKHVKGIDIVFAGHDHRSFAEYVLNGKDSVLLLEGGDRAINLSLACVDLTIKNDKVVSKYLVPKNIPMKDFAPDKEYVRHFYKEFVAVRQFTTSVVGKLKQTISSRDAYFGPSGFIDMIHTLQMEETGADISFVAPLSFDVTVNAGDLNYQDLHNLYPFENQLYVIEMSGREIKDYLEFSYDKWIRKMNSKDDDLILLESKETDNTKTYRFKNASFNFDSAAGIIYEVDVREDSGERIRILSMANGKPFNFDSKYKVALSSYRASGGGDLLEKGAKIPFDELEGRIKERHSDIRELIYKKLKESGSINPQSLNQWKFVPEEYVKEAVVRDYNLLFQKR